MERLIKVEKYITLAEKIHKNILEHGACIWSDFEPVPFILYNDEFQVAVGENWPEHYEQVKENIWIAIGKDDELMGNTVISYHEQAVAIWDIRTWSETIDVPQATGDIFHEMFHAHQYFKLKFNGANALLGATYPHSKNSVALTLSENQFLLDIVKNPEPKRVLENLKIIFSLRKERQAELSEDYIQYDQGTETLEGTAVYAEVKMAAKLSGNPIIEVATEYLNDLMITDTTLSNYRRRLYAVGLILCLSYDALNLDLQNEMAQTESTIFDWLTEQLNFQVEADEQVNLISEEDFKLAGKLLAAYEEEKEKKISAFTAQPFMEVEGEVKMVVFDPMNIVCHRERCLHKHGRIKINEEEKYLEHPFLVEYEGNIFNVKKMFIPADRA